MTESQDRRPREVTIAGWQALAGSVIALMILLSVAGQLNSKQMRDAVANALESPQTRGLGISVETVLEAAKYAIMVMAVLSVASLVLGYFVLRRHRGARIALTIVGSLAAVTTLFAGPAGWFATLYVVAALIMLWSKAARAWFAPATGEPRAGPAPPSPPPPSARW